MFETSNHGTINFNTPSNCGPHLKRPTGNFHNYNLEALTSTLPHRRTSQRNWNQYFPVSSEHTAVVTESTLMLFRNYHLKIRTS
jgi:hypothetical protein